MGATVKKAEIEICTNTKYICLHILNRSHVFIKNYGDEAAEEWYNLLATDLNEAGFDARGPADERKSYHGWRDDKAACLHGGRGWGTHSHLSHDQIKSINNMVHAAAWDVNQNPAYSSRSL